MLPPWSARLSLDAGWPAPEAVEDDDDATPAPVYGDPATEAPDVLQARLDRAGWTECPRMHGAYWCDPVTLQLRPVLCRRLGCPVCVLIEARRRSRAIAFARPERAILLTQVGCDYAAIRPRMVDVARWVRAETGKPFEWVWHVEENPRGTGHHVHAWQHGSFVPQADLARIARRAGCGGVAFINRIRSGAAASTYGLKGLGYGLKAVTEGHADTYLRLNGDRLTHQSRGYFRDAEGGVLAARDAEVAASRGLRESVGGAEVEWHRVIVRPGVMPR